MTQTLDNNQLLLITLIICIGIWYFGGFKENFKQIGYESRKKYNYSVQQYPQRN
jgi:hypothetical protein